MDITVGIQNYRCFRDALVTLGEFNVLIGPNDSGKTAFLECLEILGAASCLGKTSIGLPEISEATGGPLIAPSLSWRNDKEQPAQLQLRFDDTSPKVLEVRYFADRPGFAVRWPNSTQVPPPPAERESRLGQCNYISLNPRCLKERSDVGSDRMEGSGRGFPTMLMDFLRRDRRSFAEMEEAFYSRFPQYRAIHIRKEGKQFDHLKFIMADEQEYDATSISDGVVLYLAFLALSFQPDPPRTILIEEPENGIHYANLAETVKTLRALSEDRNVRVVMTTHSPMLLDMVEPEEVRVFQKDDEGAAYARSLTEFPDVGDMRKHFQPGEIWTVLGAKERI